MAQNFKTKNGGQIAYEINGTGQPICFIHGFSLDNSMWDEQVAFFSMNYQVLRYDMRGFGSSSLPQNPYRHDDDFFELINSLGLENIVLVGLSLGGEVAIDFTLEHPQLVRKLILVDSSLSGFHSTVDWNVYAKEQGLEKAKQNWLNHEVFETTNLNLSAKNKLAKIIQRYSGWHWLNSDPRQRPTPLAIDRIDQIDCPTMITVGQKDLAYFHEISALLENKIKNSQRIEIADTGHMVPLEKPHEFNQIVSDFLSTPS
jgi:pimeloyl-ACP methyl ester carboxylesterase